jgi:hypothetical protein
MNGATTKRLTQLEGHWKPPASLDAAQRAWEREQADRMERFRTVFAEFMATGERLLATMAPTDGWEVHDDFAQAMDGSFPEDLQSPLSHAVFWIAENVNRFWFPPVGPGKPYDRPLALPPVICRALRADEDTARHFHSMARSPFDCADCGYRVPQASHAMYNRLRAAGIGGYAPLSYFDHCPLCGGLVACDAHAIVHSERYTTFVREHLRPAPDVEQVQRFVFEERLNY